MDTRQSNGANAIVAAIDIRNALKLTMKRLSYTPKTLATGLGLPSNVVKCWVNGRGILSREQYLALCKHLGVDHLEGARI